MADTGEAVELKVLRLGMYMSLVFAAAPLIIAIATDSNIMLFEAKYGLVDAVLAYMTLVAYRKIQLPPDSGYHYGYAKYEPLVNALEGIMLLAVCATTILSAVQDIVHEDNIAHGGLIIAYTFFSTWACLGMGVFFQRQGRKCHSELLQADSKVWFIDGLMSLGACAAFVLMHFLGRTQWKHFTPYIDPGLAIIVSLALLPTAKEVLADSLRDLLDANPGGEIQKQVEQLFAECCARHGLPGAGTIRLRKAGRRLFVAARFPDDQAKTKDELRAVRRELGEELRRTFHDVDLHLYFDRTAAALPYR